MAKQTQGDRGAAQVARLPNGPTREPGRHGEAVPGPDGPYLQRQGLLAVIEGVIEDNSSQHEDGFGILEYVIFKQRH